MPVHGTNSIAGPSYERKSSMLEAKRVADRETLYEKYVNPQWVRLLDVLQMNVEYARCIGAELHTTDGRRILDFISGYCVHNVGHNHPRVIAALKHELDRNGPAMLQSHVSDVAGELAARLCERAGGRLTKAFFDSSGSEGIETVLKFARAHTARPGVLYAAGGFHGLTCGALSLMSNPFWREGFGPMLPDTEAVPFGDLDELARRLATRRFAAFILEPIQAESGVLVPPREYLQQAQALCRRHGTLLVLDEVQTGMYRTGRFLAAHHFCGRTGHGRARQSAQRRPGSMRRGADVGCSEYLGVQLAQARGHSHFDIQRKQSRDARRVGDSRRA
jgi:ornithine--oxo-acid transaminase